MNPAQLLRRRVVRSLLGLGGGRARVLDIGCGQGDLLEELCLRHPEAELCGMDHSGSGVGIARSKVPTASFLQWDLLQEAPPPARLRSWATHAVCSEVLEHIDDPEVLLQNARAFLAPGCRLAVTVPGGPMSAFDRHIGHRRHFSPGDLRGLLQSAGFEVEMTRSIGFPFFNLYRLVVILRGEQLVRDLTGGEEGRPSRTSRLVMHAFRVLFALNPPRSPWGWQVVGVARVPQQAVR